MHWLTLGLTDRFRVTEIRILMTCKTEGSLVTSFPGPLHLTFHSKVEDGEGAWGYDSWYCLITSTSSLSSHLLSPPVFSLLPSSLSSHLLSLFPSSLSPPVFSLLPSSLYSHLLSPLLFSLLPLQVAADLPVLQQVGSYCHPTRGQSVTHHYAPSQVHWSSPGHVLPRQEAAVYPTVHQVKSNKLNRHTQAWVPVYPSCAAQHGYSAAGSVFSGNVNNSFGSDRCYSLFSEQQSPFGVSLLPSPRPPEGHSSATVVASGAEPSSKFDEWPTF